MTLIDTNILLDITTDDPRWSTWSLKQLEIASLAGPLLVNDVVYAEMAGAYETEKDLREFLDIIQAELVAIPRQAFFMAGKAYRQYRKSGGERNAILADFFIGAHAASTGIPLLTRDVRKYRTYFPDVKLIAPET